MRLKALVLVCIFYHGVLFWLRNDIRGVTTVARMLPIWIHKRYQHKHKTLDYNALERKLEKSKISKRKLAEKVGMSWPGFFRMLKNETMTVEILERIAEALKMSPCELLQELGANPSPTKSDQSKETVIDSIDQPELIKEIQGIRIALEKMALVNSK